MEYVNISIYLALLWITRHGMALYLPDKHCIEVSHTEIQQNVWNDLWNTWTLQFMALSKLGSIMDILEIGIAQHI